MGKTLMNVKMLARMSVWLVILGVMTAGLTFCNGPTPGEVATVTPGAVSQAVDTPVPSSTPVSATDTPTVAEPTKAVVEEAIETPTPEPTEVATEEPTLEPTEVVTEEPTAEPTEVATEEPTPEPTQEATEEATAAAVVDVSTLSSDNCVNCHTNQETLQALAEDKKVTSEASLGEG
jgi:outer membrane biosynthesis protein TonB